MSGLARYVPAVGRLRGYRGSLDMLRRHPDAAAWAPRLFREPDEAATAFSARPPRGAR